MMTGPPYTPQVMPKVPGAQFLERINCITEMKEYAHVSFEELRLSYYLARRSAPTADTLHSDMECEFEPEDETELLKQRVMAEMQAVDWKKTINLQLHSNVSNGGTVYANLGEVETSGKTVYAFSGNTVRPNQVIKIQVAAPNHRPIIAAGFTSRDPASLEMSLLPNQAADLLSRPEYWQFNMFNLYESKRILMKIKPNGEVLVMFGETDWRVFTVDVRNPLWFFIQAAGGIKTVYCRHTTSSFNYERPERTLRRRNGATAGISVTDFGGFAEFQALNYTNMQPLTLHSNYSRGITLFNNVGEITIYNKDTLFYAFSESPAKVDQVYNIKAKTSKPETKLHIGFTSRDPASLDVGTLPDAAALGMSPDYWIYMSFDLDKASRIVLKMKNRGEVLTMFGEADMRKFSVDISSPVWLFMHATGGVNSLACHTKSAEPEATHPTPNPSVSPNPGPSNVPSNSTPNVTDSDNDEDECVICYSNRVDSVLINCRHAFCFDCAEQVQHCPICRQWIYDVALMSK